MAIAEIQAFIEVDLTNQVVRQPRRFFGSKTETVWSSDAVFNFRIEMKEIGGTRHLYHETSGRHILSADRENYIITGEYYKEIKDICIKFISDLHNEGWDVLKLAKYIQSWDVQAFTISTKQITGYTEGERTFSYHYAPILPGLHKRQVIEEQVIQTR